MEAEVSDRAITLSLSLAPLSGLRVDVQPSTLTDPVNV